LWARGVLGRSQSACPNSDTLAWRGGSQENSQARSQKAAKPLCSTGVLGPQTRHSANPPSFPSSRDHQLSSFCLVPVLKVAHCVTSFFFPLKYKISLLPASQAHPLLPVSYPSSCYALSTHTPRLHFRFLLPGLCCFYDPTRFSAQNIISTFLHPS
jgi:hypothetical protein